MPAALVGPFKERHLVVNGWQVPLLEAIECDGGKVAFLLDHRFELQVEARDFDSMAGFLAQTVAVALGLPCHPRDEKMPFEEAQRMWALLPHRALVPRRVNEITAISAVDGSGKATDA